MELTGFELDIKTREVTTQELDSLVKELKLARDDYDQAKTISNDKNRIVDELERKLIELMSIADKNSYEVDGVARVSVVTKSQVTTPKTIEQKKEFFEWIRSKLGEDGLLAYLNVNYQSLNSLYNSEMKLAIEKGEDFVVPGLDLPSISRTLSMRSK